MMSGDSTAGAENGYIRITATELVIVNKKLLVAASSPYATRL